MELSSQKLPPLPQLEIHGLTAGELSQDRIDNILYEIYSERPDLFFMIYKWEKKGENISKEEKEQKDEEYAEIYRYLHKSVSDLNSMQHNPVIWELQRRVKVMFGLSKQLPPLPNLEINSYSAQKIDNEKANKIISEIYNNKPEFFIMIADWDQKGENLSLEEKDLKDEDYAKIHHYLKATQDLKSDQYNPVIWELQKRARLMFNLPVSY